MHDSWSESTESNVILSLPGLTVTIDADYTPPPDFVAGPNDYRAASAVTLTCQVTGVVWTYQWTSTCTGPSSNCFVPGKRTETITRTVLRSTDSGNHACIATRSGMIGSATIEMNVVGELSQLSVRRPVKHTWS